MFDSLTSRKSSRRVGPIGAAIALVAIGAVGPQSFADESEGPDSNPAPAPAGELVRADQPLVQTSGATFDPTVLTKFIPARGFVAHQGAGSGDDETTYDAMSCIASGATSGGSATDLWAPVELPDGARIKRVTFFGADTDPASNISVTLHRNETRVPLVLGTPSTRVSTLVNNFTTSGSSGVALAVAGTDNLEELVGTPFTGALATTINHRFHSIEVILNNAAGNDHVLCGVEVQYQVPVPANPGAVFHPINPVRAFDSRIGAFANSGPLEPNTSRVIPIKDGFDLDGVAIPAQANSVPAAATAITYNITVVGSTGSNFVSVTAGDATEFTTSAINHNGTGASANGLAVTIAADRTIKVWGGDGVGSTDFIIDITGYYAPDVPSNMGN